MNLMAVRLTEPHRVVPLVQTPFDERNAIVSPDNRWLAYEANDSGTFQIYVRSFPDVNRERWQVSTNGGVQPLWNQNGQELFYFAPDGALMRVPVGSASEWKSGAPSVVVRGTYVVATGGNIPRDYDVTPDGQRFLMLKSEGRDQNSPPHIVVVQHFDEELKRLVPTK
jgi:serine/threonine-protein kinase